MNSVLHCYKNGFEYFIILLTSIAWTDFNGELNQLCRFESDLREIKEAQKMSSD